LILASGSAIRRHLLESAGLTFEVMPPRVDEEAAKASLRMQGLSPKDQADALAELKALSISQRTGGLVIGADQMLAIDGEALDKPPDMASTRGQLKRLRGKAHYLICAAAVACDGQVIWRRIDMPKLTMRSFSDAFLDEYLRREGEVLLRSVGGYRLEGMGAQLFDSVEGDYFSVLGLPLLPLLAFLREHGVVSA
jgi:septum formation protein